MRQAQTVIKCEELLRQAADNDVWQSNDSPVQPILEWMRAGGHPEFSVGKTTLSLPSKQTMCRLFRKAVQQGRSK